MHDRRSRCLSLPARGADQGISESVAHVEVNAPGDARVDTGVELLSVDFGRLLARITGELHIIVDRGSSVYLLLSAGHEVLVVAHPVAPQIGEVNEGGDAR